MASPISVAAFAFRDVVKYVLPTMLAYALFVPFFQSEINFDSALIAAVLLGYVLTLLVGNVYGWILRKLSKTFRNLTLRTRMNNARWDYRVLTVNLSKDENDALYLTDSYGTLYLLFSAYFLTYALVMAWQLYRWYGLMSPPCIFEWRTVFTCARVPTAFGTDISALALLLASLVLWWVALKAYFMEYQVLNLINYPSLAEKYQRNGLALARAIWGSVKIRAEGADKVGPAEKVCIQLLDSNGDVLRIVETDDEGIFTLSDTLPKNLNRQLTLVVPDYPDESPVYLYLTAKDVPETHIEIKASLGQKNPATPSRC